MKGENMGSYAKAIFLMIILAFLVTFGIKNSQAVQLSYYFQAQAWSLPLYAVVYASVVIGVLMGMVLGLSKRMGLRKTIRSLDKENRKLKDTVGREESEERPLVPSEGS
jgi:uncharacterized integral membrane protein